jgi:hypothetical protein
VVSGVLHFVLKGSAIDYRITGLQDYRMEGLERLERLERLVLDFEF